MDGLAQLLLASTSKEGMRYTTHSKEIPHKKLLIGHSVVI
jgi:hypothetical protein